MSLYMFRIAIIVFVSKTFSASIKISCHTRIYTGKLINFAKLIKVTEGEDPPPLTAKAKKGAPATLTDCSASLNDLRVCLGINLPDKDGSLMEYRTCIEDENGLITCDRICNMYGDCNIYVAHNCLAETIAYYECKNSLVRNCLCGLAEEIDIDVKNLRA